MKVNHAASISSQAVAQQNVSTPATRLTTHPDLLLGLQTAIDQTGSYIFTKDMAGRYTYVNLKVQELFNCGADQIIGKDDTAFFDLVLANDLSLNDRRVLDFGEVIEREEVTIVKLSGERRIYWAVKKAIRNEQGQIIGMCGVSTDITELKLKEEKLRQSAEEIKVSQIIAGLGTYTLDMREGVWTSSDVMDQIFEIDASYPHTVVGWEELISPQDRAMMHEYFLNEVCGQKKRFDKEYRIIRKLEQTERWMHGLGQLEFDVDGHPIKMSGTIQDITERKIIEQTLIESESQFRALVEQSIAGIYIIQNGMFAYVNPSFSRIFRYGSPEDIIGKVLVSDLVVPEDRDTVAEYIRQRVETEATSTRYRFNGLCADGAQVVVEVHGSALLYKGMPAVIGLIIDETERKQAEFKLSESESRLRAIIDNEPECIKILDAQGSLIQMNPAGLAMIEADSLQQVMGNSVLNIIVPEHRFAFTRMLKRVIAGESEQLEFEIVGLKGGRRWLESHAVPMQDKGRPVLLSITRDITERKNHEKQLQHIAHYDSLTNLPNRVLLADRLHQGMNQVQRRNKLLSVVYIDLDGFKGVNDKHGHDIGDHLLVTLATRMKHALREGDTLARLGGDEFVAVLLDFEDSATSVPLISRLLEVASEKIHVGEHILQVSASIGVTNYPQTENVDADQLLRQADQAMYQAKLSGKNRYHVFDTAQDISIRGHNESLEQVRRALISREFVLYYQPKVNMRTGKVIGAEALIRWLHPEKGLLPPAAFLPVIEDHQLAVQIGEWVIDKALTQMEIWHAEGLDIPVSINIGARQLQQPGFVMHLQEAFAKHPEIKPSCLELEVLETSALEDFVLVSQVIESLRKFGVMFALDDFGTGYSSLTYLKRLPVRTLKIDQTFVRNMLDDTDDIAILDGVLSLAYAFRREVIAEGVETLEHGAMLLQLGCEFAQGYGIARPMPAHEMCDWVSKWRPDQSWSNQAAVSRDDLPLLFAGVEHRAWILSIEQFLRDESNAPPTLDHLHCRLGEWLNDIGLIRYGSQPSYPIIHKLHQQVHSLASEIIELKKTGFNKDSLNKLSELYELRSELLSQLKNLTPVNT